MSKFKTKKLLKLLATATLSCVAGTAVFGITACDSCNDNNQGDGHTHTFSSEWDGDENEHWHNAICEHTNEKSDKGAHVDNEPDGGDGICDVCGKPVSKADPDPSDHNHNEHLVYVDNEDGATHHQKCTEDDYVTADAPHVYDQKEGTECICGAKKPTAPDPDNPNPPVTGKHDYAYVQNFADKLVDIEQNAVAGTEMPAYSDGADAGFYVAPDGSASTGKVKYALDGATMVVQQEKGDATNFHTVIAVGEIKTKVAGYMEIKLSEVGSKHRFFRLRNGGSDVFCLSSGQDTATKADLMYTLDGTNYTKIDGVTLAKDTYYKVYFEIDLATGKLTVEFNENAVVTELEAGINNIDSVRLVSGSSGARLITARNVIVSGVPKTLAEKAEVKLADLKAKYDALAAKTIPDTDPAELAYDQDGLDELKAAYDAGVGAITSVKDKEGATDEDLSTAYTNAIAALDAVKTKAEKQAAAEAAELQAAKDAAIAAINAVTAPSDVTLTEANEATVASKKAAGIEAVNAVEIGADVDLAAAKEAVEAAKTAAINDLNAYFEILKMPIEDAIEAAKEALGTYLDGKIAEAVAGYTADEKTTLTQSLVSALAETFATQQSSLDGAADADALAEKVATAQNELDDALAAEFEKDCNVTITEYNETVSVKFGAKLKVSDLHVTAYNVTAATCNDAALPEGGLLITGNITVNVTVAEIENFSPKGTFTPAESSIKENTVDNGDGTTTTQTVLDTVSNSLFDLSINDKGMTYKSAASAKIGEKTYNGAVLSSNIAAGANNSAAPYVITIKENLPSLTVLLGLSDSTGTNKGRDGSIHVVVNGVDTVIANTTDKNTMFTANPELTNLKAGDEIKIWAEVAASSSGSRLLLFVVDAQIDESKVTQTVRVEWNDQRGNNIKGSTGYRYYEGIECPEPQRIDSDHGDFLGWYEQGKGHETLYKTGDKLPAGDHVLVPYYAFNVQVNLKKPDGEGGSAGAEIGTLHFYSATDTVIVTGLPVLTADDEAITGWLLDGVAFNPGTHPLTVGSVDDCNVYTLVAQIEAKVPVDTVVITSAETSVEINKTITLTATVTPNNATVKTVTWSIKAGGEEYAEIDPATGVLKGLKVTPEGTKITVVATADGVTAEKELSVIAPTKDIKTLGFTNAQLPDMITAINAQRADDTKFIDEYNVISIVYGADVVNKKCGDVNSIFDGKIGTEARHITIDLTKYKGKATVVLGVTHSSGTGRKMFISETLTTTLDETILSVATVKNANTTGTVELDCGKKYYICADNTVFLSELTVTLDVLAVKA